MDQWMDGWMDGWNALRVWTALWRRVERFWMDGLHSGYGRNYGESYNDFELMDCTPGMDGVMETRIAILDG